MSSTDNAYPQKPLVYLAHASQDHNSLAKPLAERMMAEGIDVWLDKWELRSGDSLRRKMEDGLGSCTHFLVLLTRSSLGKPWVEVEIDAGFVRAIEGKSRFIGVRIRVAVDELSEFLRTRLCPEVHLDNSDEVADLIGDIRGDSRKPELGPGPRYISTLPESIGNWSPAAASIAEYVVRTSQTGAAYDPNVNPAKVAQATGLPERDVRLGILELEDRDLIERSDVLGSNDFLPLSRLFVEFDPHFSGFDNRLDAIEILNRLVSEDVDEIEIAELAKLFPEWPPRRMNSALNYLEVHNGAETEKWFNRAPWALSYLRVTDRTHRFVRDNN